jgi:multidrug efflux pump subunit AcrA (membrane-fusion protein)
MGNESRGPAIVQSRAQRRAELTAAVPAKQGTAVKPGQVVHFVADARNFDGTVARVSPTIDPTTRAITVYVTVPNRDGALKGGTSRRRWLSANAHGDRRTHAGASPIGGERADLVYRVASRAVEAGRFNSA